jgi:nucleotide-binding universal stress UspA family protein
MKRFKNILLALSGNDRSAIARAVALAKTNGARLTAVKVLDELANGTAPSLAGLQPSQLLQLLKQYAQEESEKAIAPYLKKHGQRATTKILLGDAFVEIIREVVEQEHDLVISSADHRPGFTGRLFGSTNMHLMRKCPCPVWVVKPTRKRRYMRVLAAVEPSRTEPGELSLNRKLLELANSLAARDDGELHIVHAWRLFGESMLRGGGRTPRFDFDDALRTLRQDRERQLQELINLAGIDATQAHVHLLKGKADTVIPHLVRRAKIDVVVMGTVSRTGMGGLLIGNTAENTLSQVDCSVLTVKPDGFVTPITTE